MCGIAGYLDGKRGRGLDAARAVVVRMTDAIRHRGPDDEGQWQDPATGLTLGHRRLSILDLTEAGHQPMVSASGRYVMVYNGEVYNAASLRQELDAAAGPAAWKGHSDTETMLEAIERWGLDAAVRRFNGMFAFVVWDRQERILSLVRDRLGKKPLYYGWSEGSFLFASEIKAIRASGVANNRIHRGAIALLLRMNYIPSPHSILEGIHKLPPGCILTLPLSALASASGMDVNASDSGPCVGRPYRYWSARSVLEQGAANPLQGDHDAMLNELDGLLRDAVSLRMIADVPLGAFLSGGVDSSIVVALMQAQSSRPVKTYAIGFHEKGGDEAGFAKAVAEHLCTQHTELYVRPEDALALVPRLPAMSDEPHADLAVIPTFLVSQLARQEVTVALAGDGGDELFAGYPRYLWAHDRWIPEQKRFGWLGRTGKKAVAHMAGVPGAKDALGDLDRALSLESPESVYQDWVFHWRNPSEVVIGANEPLSLVTNPAEWSAMDDPIQRMVYLDLASRLPDSIVSKVDRTSMQVSLEARAPLLDYRVVEFAARVPTEMKFHEGMGKWFLRELLHRYVPRDLVERPKKGFKMPIATWMRGALKDWACALLDPARLRQEGYFQESVVTEKWQAHLAGSNRGSYLLWDVLMVQAWMESAR